jgi:hypothetical protein
MTARQILAHPAHVGDMGSALAAMTARYLAIPAADRAANLAREAHLRAARSIR